MNKAPVILLFSIVFFACIHYADGQPLTALQKSRIEKQVDSLFRFTLAFGENLDYEKLSTVVDDEQRAGFIIGNVYYSSYDSMLADLKTRAQGVIKQSIKVEKEKVTVLSEDIALLTAYGLATVHLSNGNTIPTQFYWSFVYQKLNGEWKVIQSHQSTSR